jgi:hypothetical protein
VSAPRTTASRTHGRTSRQRRRGTAAPSPGAIHCAAHSDRDAATTFTSQTRLGSTGLREDANTRACMSIVDMPMCDGGIDRHGTARCHVLWVNENSANYCVLVAGFILYPTTPQFLAELRGH